MQKPNGYDEATAAGEFTPVELGGHYCIIKQVSEVTSSTGKEMIVVLLDFNKQDRQPGYFSKMFENDDREEKKWPFNGTKYIMVYDYNEPNKTSRQFKTFCTCVEKSNNFEITWGGNKWADQFKGKQIGAVYGEEEHEYDGKVSMRRLPKYFCKTEAVKDAEVPKAKLLDKPKATAATDTDGFDADGFMSLPKEAEDKIPY